MRGKEGISPLEGEGVFALFAASREKFFMDSATSLRFAQNDSFFFAFFAI